MQTSAYPDPCGLYVGCGVPLLLPNCMTACLVHLPAYSSPPPLSQKQQHDKQQHYH